MMIGIKKVLGKAIGSVFVIITVLAFLGLTPKADALTIPSEEIVMIDGTGDGDSTVQIMANEYEQSIEFGYIDDSTFISITSGGLGFFTFNGGAIVDFAIREIVDGTTVVTSTSSGDATMDFQYTVPAANSQIPIVWFDYYRTLEITWAPTSMASEMVVSMSSLTDGFAPAHSTGYNPGHGNSVPDASIMFLLGPALLGLGVFNRKSKRS